MNTNLYENIIKALLVIRHKKTITHKDIVDMFGVSAVATAIISELEFDNLIYSGGSYYVVDKEAINNYLSEPSQINFIQTHNMTIQKVYYTDKPYKKLDWTEEMPFKVIFIIFGIFLCFSWLFL